MPLNVVRHAPRVKSMDGEAPNAAVLALANALAALLAPKSEPTGPSVVSDDERSFYTVKHLASRWAVSRRTVKAWMDRGLLEKPEFDVDGVRRGRIRRWSRAQVLEFEAGRKS